MTERQYQTGNDHYCNRLHYSSFLIIREYKWNTDQEIGIHHNFEQIYVMVEERAKLIVQYINWAPQPQPG